MHQSCRTRCGMQLGQRSLACDIDMDKVMTPKIIASFFRIIGTVFPLRGYEPNIRRARWSTRNRWSLGFRSPAERTRPILSLCSVGRVGWRAVKKAQVRLPSLEFRSRSISMPNPYAETIGNRLFFVGLGS
jgi:hypothetical protein